MSWYPARWLLEGATSPVLQRQTDTVRDLIKKHGDRLEVRRMPLASLAVRDENTAVIIGYVPVDGGLNDAPSDSWEGPS